MLLAFTGIWTACLVLVLVKNVQGAFRNIEYLKTTVNIGK